MMDSLVFLNARALVGLHGNLACTEAIWQHSQCSSAPLCAGVEHMHAPQGIGRAVDSAGLWSLLAHQNFFSGMLRNCSRRHIGINAVSRQHLPLCYKVWGSYLRTNRSVPHALRLSAWYIRSALLRLAVHGSARIAVSDAKKHV